MRLIDRPIYGEAAREGKFVAFGLFVFLVVLFPGVLFYKSMINGASASSAASVDSAVRARHQALLDQIGRELEMVTAGHWASPGKAGQLRINRDVSKGKLLDLALFFDQERTVVDGIKRTSEHGPYADISPEDGADLVPVDAGFFDAVRDGQIISGVIEIESQPVVMAIREVDVAGVSGFLLIARRYNTAWLKVEEAKLHEDGLVNMINLDDFRTFRLSDGVSLSDSVKGSMSAAIQNKGWSYMLNGSKGLVYTVIDDLLRRPMIMVQTPWIMPGYLSSDDYYRNFFVTSFFAGVIGWWLLRWGDLRSRSRTRRFDGLAGLSKENLRILVEGFPGYAFALDPNMKYLAVSRVLAGVTGQEPAEFVGHAYGNVCSELDDGLFANAFSDLRDRGHWPPIRTSAYTITGLGESHQFVATAHYLSKQDVMLVMLTKKESAQTVRSPESFIKPKKADSAVA